MEFDQRGYVIGFSFPGMFHLHNDLAAAVLSFCILFRNFDALFDTLDDNLFRVRQAYQLLNPQGQEEAAKRIEELTEIPKYRESPSDKK